MMRSVTMEYKTMYGYMRLTRVKENIPEKQKIRNDTAFKRKISVKVRGQHLERYGGCSGTKDLALARNEWKRRG